MEFQTRPRALFLNFIRIHIQYKFKRYSYTKTIQKTEPIKKFKNLLTFMYIAIVVSDTRKTVPMLYRLKKNIILYILYVYNYNIDVNL